MWPTMEAEEGSTMILSVSVGKKCASAISSVGKNFSSDFRRDYGGKIQNKPAGQIPLCYQLRTVYKKFYFLNGCPPPFVWHDEDKVFNMWFRIRSRRSLDVLPTLKSSKSSKRKQEGYLGKEEGRSAGGRGKNDKCNTLLLRMGTRDAEVEAADSVDGIVQ
ncbi:hypothetical protein Cni_G09506 [Canna indica]|uniref:Uncharacterized protein n=1 Tax=Canna indica TaxID=4628 RepID=A0AAQ3Q9D3_9LILI|nr:hypothetical protein Cni_G09506 [Canna indica]